MVREWRDELLVTRGGGAGALLWPALIAVLIVSVVIFSCAEGMKAKGSAADAHAAACGGGCGAGCGAGCGGQPEGTSNGGVIFDQEIKVEGF